MDKNKLLDYAKLLIKKGVNVEKGDILMIKATLDQPEFVNLCVEEAYKAGAKKVKVEFYSNDLQRLDLKYQDLNTLSNLEDYEVEREKFEARFLPSTLWLDADNPDAFNGLDMNKINKALLSVRKIKKPYRDAYDGKVKWCIAAVPSPIWAKKVFPKEKNETKAMEKLWDAIFKTARVDGKNACANWDKHNKDLIEKRRKLEKMSLKTLHYKSKNGTDFTVELIHGITWGGGIEKTASGKTFNPNIPSEEVFTSPYLGKAEGKVIASKPLSYSGTLIDKFGFVFKNGKVQKVFAKKGQKVLEHMINNDKGSRMLGECALVPFDSPINKTGILFYNTLFDENACCHFALGAGFKELLKNGDKYTVAEATKLGLNDSVIHVDFMIGTKDLNIEGIDDEGHKYQIFKNGTWAF